MTSFVVDKIPTEPRECPACKMLEYDMAEVTRTTCGIIGRPCLLEIGCDSCNILVDLEMLAKEKKEREEIENIKMRVTAAGEALDQLREQLRIDCPETLYAIREADTGKVIWNARGSAYKHLDHVEKKLLKLYEKNPDKYYMIISWDLRENDKLFG